MRSAFGSTRSAAEVLQDIARQSHAEIRGELSEPREVTARFATFRSLERSIACWPIRTTR